MADQLESEYGKEKIALSPLDSPLRSGLILRSDHDQRVHRRRIHVYSRRIFKDMSGERKNAASLRPDRASHPFPG